ncbi:MAG: DUF4268 domain-containing protein [Bacteroidia bacterium]
MYLIKRDENRIAKIEKKPFSELGFKERDHLQEWIANSPEILGEDLLIIQKEFDGFNDTRERLDLLALDKQMNLVIIENKLDDTGRDVTWQVLKYTSYCSTLTTEQIKKIYQDYLTQKGSHDKAEQNLLDFFGITDIAELNLNSGQTQRIIMIAGNFRKEVTSTVLWLLSYKLRIQCFKVTPFQLGDQLLLNLEQIIPIKETEEYIISMSEKTQQDINTQEELKNRHFLRIDFWKEFINKANSNPKLTAFQSISPSKDAWLATGSGISGVGLNVVISNYYARVEVYMSRSQKEENKYIFRELEKLQLELEDKFGDKLEWEVLEDKKASRIKYELKDVDYFNKDNWARMMYFMVDNYIKLENAFREPLAKINKQLKNKKFEEI